MQNSRQSKRAKRNRETMGNINVPFDIQRTGAARKAAEELLTFDQIERLRSLDDTRELGLRYLHDPQAFALLWSSKTIRPELRRTMRKLIQIQTINAVNNGFEKFENRFEKIIFLFQFQFLSTCRWRKSFSGQKSNATRSRKHVEIRK